MREVVRCSGCRTAAWCVPCGFTSVPYLICRDRSDTVDQDDGCTFGMPGEPGTASDAPDVDLVFHAAVDGDRNVL